MLGSNNAFDKLSSGAKTLGLGTLKESLQNVFRKPWGSTYPTEVIFEKWFLYQTGGQGDGGFQMTLVITRRSLRTIIPCNHITLVWDGA
jgi:hypothetical protein